jgi:tetratricopeptide (TPR) repeat protein
VVDSANEVREKDEANNSLKIEISFAPGFVDLRKARADAWANLEFAEAERINGDMAAFLDAELERYKGDRTWLDYDWFAQRGFCALVSGDLDRAEEVLSWGTELLPVYIPNYRLLASVALRRGRVPEAKRILADLEREGSFNSPYWHNELREGDPLVIAAQHMVEAGSPEAARTALEKCVEQTPANAEAWWLLFELRSGLGMPESALSALKGYSDAGMPSEAPGIPFYEAIYETLVYRLNRPEEAGYWIGKAIEDYPEDDRFHFLLPYIEYASGVPSGEVRVHVRRILEERRSLRGLVAALHLLAVRLDLDLGDMASLARDYAGFVFHSSNTAPTSGFRAWPRVALARTELNPDLRVLTGEDMTPLNPVPITFRLEKSDVPEPASLPEPATLESPVLLTVDLGYPRRADACALSFDMPPAKDLNVEISVLDESGVRKVAEATAISEEACAVRFAPVRSRYWQFRVTAREGNSSAIRIRDLLLSKAPPVRER